MGDNPHRSLLLHGGNVEQEAQKDLVDSGQINEEPIFDNTPFAGKTSKYEKFSDIKV